MNLLLLAADDASLTAAEQTVSDSTIGWVAFLAVIAVIVVPFVVGNLLANVLKMRDYGTKIGIVLFSLTLGLTPFVSRAVTGQNPLSAIDLGIDLAGGANMTFQVDRAAAAAEDKEITGEVMDKMVAAVGRRVNPTGTEEVTVRKVGEDRLEVIVPGADQEKVEQVKRDVTNLGELEFALLATDVDHSDLIDLARERGDESTEIFRDGKLVAKWRRSARDNEGNLKVFPGERVHTRTRTINGKEATEFLVVVDPDPKRRITGRLLKSVREQFSDRGLAVGFTFNDRGGYLFQQLTSKYQPRQGADYKSRLAVLLNDEIHSAPTINAVIGATGQIDGNFSQEEIDELISVLNAGALEVPLIKEPVSEFTVSPQLGVDVQKKGFTAIIIGTIAVFVVTLGYYLTAGFVADVCLAINIVLVLGAMSLIDATFTLPGLAGLVLTIGMAVDANVLIFERIREEREKGSSLRMAIKNGFEKAFSTIFDANVTTLITAVVLYYIGTDQVKGFAVTLFIGIIMSMFSAVYIGRLIFDIAEHKRWITDLKMFCIIRPENWNFLGKKGMAAVLSLILIGIGLAAVATRGADNLDIDFRGGSMVTFKFEGEAPPIEEVRSHLESQFEKNISLERLSVVDNGQEQTLFRMRTIEPNAQNVSDKIKEAFADHNFELVQQHVTLGEVVQIPESEAPTPDDEPADQFAGGSRIKVSLSESMLPNSLAEEAESALKTMERYKASDDLITASSVSGEGSKVNEIELSVASAVNAADVKTMLEVLKTDLEKDPHFEEINTFDTAVAGETKTAAITAMVFSLLAIIGYLWVRFQRVSFGLAACAALIHDVLIVLGLLALGAYLSGNPVGSILMLEDFKINLPIVAAFLTIIGYSLNDTIVVFDRIREVRGKNPALTTNMVNESLNQTLSRTLLTSITTLIVVLILYAIGGEGIHGFAYCLVLGVIVGTYSSIFI
ncbi:MAG: protein translocase subunit SecD, partial [Planctomycetaceae bacterium]|nr:protein translocase subunit SecD [Planctomycetaceae bacterium]